MDSSILESGDDDAKRGDAAKKCDEIVYEL